MISPFEKDPGNKFDSLEKLIGILKEDPLINSRVIQMLKMRSYQRRSVLNLWLEQLRNRNASQDLLNALSCLFDDKIANEILTIINNKKI